MDSGRRESNAGGWRILHRLVGQEELDRIRTAKQETQGSHQQTMEMAETLTQRMGAISSHERFGEILHTHTMTPIGGGQIGGRQPLVSMTSDLSHLARSTDDAVQSIVQHAPFVASFTVPKTSAMGAPSDLSHFEGEVVMPNHLKALGAMLHDYGPNPFARSTSSSSTREKSTSRTFPKI